MQKIILCLFICLTMSACGWHLRGSVTGSKASSTPIELNISTKDNYSPLLNSIRQSLRVNRITEANGSAAYTLTVETEVMDKRTAGVGADALTSAYELILSVEYTIQHKAETLTAPKTKASISRTYNYNVNNAATAAQEEELILREMRRELAQQILRRVKNLSDRQTAIQGDNNAKTAR